MAKEEVEDLYRWVVDVKAHTKDSEALSFTTTMSFTITKEQSEKAAKEFWDKVKFVFK
tara:strand:- start:5609 stop:5782 length:174 start_codon:yes stop_codon:yes gene_type:complete